VWGALCVRSAILGAHLNVKINASGIEDKVWLDTILSEAKSVVVNAIEQEKKILEITNKIIAGN
jgi:glutamate formiminotransferase / formiminotetrahydrofolate cyclodeaminase